MTQISEGKRRSNLILALVLGAVALGFFVLGLYLASGEAGS